MKAKLLLALLLCAGAALAEDTCNSGDGIEPPGGGGGGGAECSQDNPNGSTSSPGYPVYKLTPFKNTQVVTGRLIVKVKGAAEPLNCGESEAIGAAPWASPGAPEPGWTKFYLQRRPSDCKYQIYVARPDGGAAWVFDPPLVQTNGAITLPIYYRWSGDPYQYFGSVAMCFGNACQYSATAPNFGQPLYVGRVDGFNGTDNNSFEWRLWQSNN